MTRPYASARSSPGPQRQRPFARHSDQCCEALDYARSGDTLIVSKLDRLAPTPAQHRVAITGMCVQFALMVQITNKRTIRSWLAGNRRPRTVGPQSGFQNLRKSFGRTP